MRIGIQGPTETGSRWQALEFSLMGNLAKSAREMGYEVVHTQRIIDPTSYDLIAFMGVKNQDVLKCAEADGVPYLYFDKAYNRSKQWWRWSYCAHNPTTYLTRMDYSDFRRQGQNWEPKNWQDNRRGHIVLAGSSAKYHKLYELIDPETYWERVVQQLRQYTDRRIIYRPKKSYGDARPIDGTIFSTNDRIEDDLKGAYAMITHGSNACFEALMEGIPTIVLGNGITRCISSTQVDDIEDLHLCTHTQKVQVLNSLAHFQLKTEEIGQVDFWSMVDDCKELREALQTPA